MHQFTDVSHTPWMSLPTMCHHLPLPSDLISPPTHTQMYAPPPRRCTGAAYSLAFVAKFLVAIFTFYISALEDVTWIRHPPGCGCETCVHAASVFICLPVHWPLRSVCAVFSLLTPHCVNLIDVDHRIRTPDACNARTRIAAGSSSFIVNNICRTTGKFAIVTP